MGKLIDIIASILSLKYAFLWIALILGAFLTKTLVERLLPQFDGGDSQSEL
jgi:hypothetical protein